MAIIISNDGDRVVATLAARDLITTPFDGMRITVLDTTGDLFTQGGKATYQWMARVAPATSEWLLVWKENIDGLEFVTESKTIAGGKVTATNIPQSGLVWGCTVQDLTAEGDTIILAEISPTVLADQISIGTSAFDGKTLVFTYGYGKIQAVVSNILASGGISASDLALKADSSSLATVATSGSYADLTNKPTIPTVPTLVSAFTNDSNFQTGAQVTTAIQAVVGAAPAAFDTLKEIADELAADNTAAAALTNTVALKAPIASPSFTGTVSDESGKLRSVPQASKSSAYTLVAADNGKNINLTASAALTMPANVFVAGDIISVYNMHSATNTITIGSGLTCYLMGTATAKTGSLTLAIRGGLTIMYISATEVLVSGNV
jgi:hypothetical protein